MEINSYLQSNARFRSLFLILIFTFVACGITLALLVQIQAYERDQIYLSTRGVLQKHKSQNIKVLLEKQDIKLVKVNAEDWYTYLDEEFGFEFKYPKSIFNIVKQSNQILLKSPYFVYDGFSDSDNHKKYFEIRVNLGFKTVVELAKNEELGFWINEMFPKNSLDNFKAQEGYKLKGKIAEGLNFYKITSGVEGLNADIIFIEKNNKLMVVIFSYFSPEVIAQRDHTIPMNQQLSRFEEVFKSFKFIK